MVPKTFVMVGTVCIRGGPPEESVFKTVVLYVFIVYMRVLS